MFFPKTLLSFYLSFLKGFFAVRSAGRFINAGYLSGFGAGSKKPLPFGVFDLAFAVAFKSAGIYVIPVLGAMGGTK